MKKTVKPVVISSGHNPDGKIACGAVGFIKESTENRYVVKHLIKKAKKKEEFTLVDCTINNAVSQSDHLNKCAKLHNNFDAFINIQIHFNSGGGQGSEVLVKDSKNFKTEAVANNILLQLKKVGFVNRGIKKRSDLYMLNHVENMIIVEVCFVDKELDTVLYKERKKEVVKAIYKGIKKSIGNNNGLDK